MAKRKVFFSFHFDNDVFRTQLVRNMGSIEKNQEVTAQAWETIKSQSRVAKWIEEQMKDKDALVVLIGEKTSERPWVLEEIKHAWATGIPIIGVYIHNLKCARTERTSIKGANPFSKLTSNGRLLSELITCYDPATTNAYGEISQKLETWIGNAKRK